MEMVEVSVWRRTGSRKHEFRVWGEEMRQKLLPLSTMFPFVLTVKDIYIFFQFVFCKCQKIRDLNLSNAYFNIYLKTHTYTYLFSCVSSKPFYFRKVA